MTNREPRPKNIYIDFNIYASFHPSSNWGGPKPSITRLILITGEVYDTDLSLQLPNSEADEFFNTKSNSDYQAPDLSNLNNSNFIKKINARSISSLIRDSDFFLEIEPNGDAMSEGRDWGSCSLYLFNEEAGKLWHSTAPDELYDVVSEIFRKCE